MAVTAATGATAPPALSVLPLGGRALVVRLSALGDVLFALETVAALKLARPDVRIDFLVEDRFAALLDDHPQLDRVIACPRRSRLGIPAALWRLRQRRYDLVLDVHGILKSGLQVLLARGRRKIGPGRPGAREGADLCYHQAVPMPTPLPHRADVGLLLLRSLGIAAPPTRGQLAVIAPPPALLDGLPRPRVLLHPGTSSFAMFKRWPVERFAALAARLHAAGCGVAVSFGPGEESLAAAVVAGTAAARLVDGAALSLRGLAGVAQQCDLVVAADTGPLHLAAAVGTRCVALFGPKDHRRYGPRSHGGAEHIVLFADVPCRPCTRRDCASPQCVLGLPVDTVADAVLAAVGRSR